jgi:hypothetical protein
VATKLSLLRKSAPAVSYPLGRSRFEGWLLLAVAALGLAACLAWVRQDAAWGWRQTLMLACLVPGLVAAAWRWRRTPAVQLHWDRQAWHCALVPDLALQRVDMLADLQTVVLLRLVGAGNRTIAWLWAEQWRQPAQWRPLRRALVSSARQHMRAPDAASEARAT